MANYYSSSGNGYRLRLELTYSNQDSTNNRTLCKTRLVLEAYTNGFNARTKLNYGVLGSSNNLANEYASSNAADYPFRDCSNADEIELGSWQDWVSHGTDGSGSFSSQAKFETWTQGYVWSCPQLTVSGTLTLPSYDRTPVKPSVPVAIRSGNGSGLSSFTYSGGVNNNGPAVSYEQRYSTNSNMSGYLAFSGSTVSLTPTSSYYFNVYASNVNGNKTSDTSSIVYGVPSAPTNVFATRNTSVTNRIDLQWTHPSNTQGGLTGYNIYRKLSTDTNFPSQPTYSISVATSYADVASLIVGSSYDYRVVAKNAVGFNTSTSHSSSATVTAVAPGVPSAPSTITGPYENPTLKVGRSVTINYSEDANHYGNASLGYFMQFSTDNGATWHGWNNATKTILTNGENLVTGGTFTYQLLTPALTYKWRVYAKNTIGTGNLSRATPFGTFVSSGGKRWTGSTYVPTESAKRWTGSGWTDITVAKRWSGTGWVDLT